MLTVSSWEVMATMPETLAQSTERMDPSPALWFGVREGRGLGLGRGLVGGCFWSPRRFLPERREGVTAVPKGRGRGVLEGGGCWHGKWQQPEPDCLGGWEGSPSGDGGGG